MIHLKACRAKIPAVQLPHWAYIASMWRRAAEQLLTSYQ